ncbi:acyltransferase [Clostridium sp.]|uniref:acyltransferase n=1 Tax=Clostridium sp. TaxID=1506 RepID=UPI0039910377
MFKSNYFKLIMKLNKVKFGKNLNLYGIPVIFKKKGSQLNIGENCTIKSSFLSNLVGLSQRTIIVTRTEEAKIEIGNNVGISGATIYARKEITIGDNTLIGGNVKILDNDFHPIEVEARNLDIKEKIGTRKIKIGKDCFIGANSLILKGVEIGDGSVVGAGSVVTGKFPSNVVIAGNPARVIKVLEREKKYA